VTDCALQLPEELAARFEVLSILGEGAFGAVVRAKDRRLEREVAIKLVSTAFDDEEVTRRFRVEAQATARLDHPAIVRVYDHGVDASGRGYIVYQLVRGLELSELAGQVGPADLRRWGTALAQALEQAHAKGILHRDVKPANVRISPEGGACLLDFGLARDVRVRTGTAAGLIVGTPRYMAPEALLQSRFSPASDQFALAATLYEAATGAPPFPDERLRDLLSGRPPPRPLPAPRLAAEAPDLLATLLRGLATAPEERWPDLATFRRALEGHPPSTAQSPLEPHRNLALLGALVMGGLALGAWALHRPPRDADLRHPDGVHEADGAHADRPASWDLSR
jgi:serine/threonine-protein kinase